ncbi:MAG: glycosyltransferase [Candidatus Brocadiia bacterium]
MIVKKTTNLEWTGERFVPVGPTADTHYEHLHRYGFAGEFVKDKKVLDVGCGEGYGSFFLAQTAKSVIGIDIDKAAINHALKKYRQENLKFKIGDVRDIPLKGKNLFDVIVCYEVLEHIKEQAKLLKEVKRLLKDDGLFIVSTPNKPVYSNKRNYRNSFHKKELDINEFSGLMKKYFKNASFLGQRIFPSSNIWDLKGSYRDWQELSLKSSGKELKYASVKRKEPFYFIAVASNGKVDIKYNSYLVDTSFRLFAEKDNLISSQNSQIEELSKWGKSLDEQIKQYEKRIVELQNEVQKIGKWGKSLESEGEEKDTLLAAQQVEIEKLGKWGQELDAGSKERDKLLVERQAEIEKLSNHSIQLDAELNQGNQRIIELQKEIENLSKWGQELDAGNKERDSLLVERQAEIKKLSDWGKSLDAELTRQGRRISELQQEAEKLGKWGQGLDAEVRQKNQVIVGLNQSISDKERIIKSLETTVTTNINLLQTFIKDHISKLEVELDKRQKHLEEMVAVLNDNKVQLKELGVEFTALKARNVELEKDLSVNRIKIVKLEAELSSGHFKMSELQGTIINKDEQILTLQKQLNNNAAKIKDMDNEIVKRGEWGVRLQKQVDELDAECVRRGQWGNRLQKEIDENNTHIANLQMENRHMAYDLEEIHNSHGWRVISVYYRFRNFILPLDSRRRRMAKATWRFCWNAVTFRWLRKNETSKVWTPPVRQTAPVQELPKSEPGQSREWKAIEFPAVSKPDVSIIIPVWNKCEYTHKCLESLVENTDGAPYEVIVVDNASEDETPQMLAKIKNIKVIRNETNLGFVGACNKGAELSKGKYILLLNNDTKVTKGWLKAMTDLAQRDDKIGLVGTKLVYPDGRLQEAGGIIWNDPINIAWNYGRLDDPKKWEYNYVKEVDYCSGACLLVRKSVLKGEDLFDTYYAPAYCEDTDLAFRVRQKGYKVMYQPKAEIIHFEGVTAGTDTAQGMKKYQVINTQKFYRKWQTVLEKEHFKNGENVFLARDRSRNKKIMLFMDNNVPTWDQDAGSVRMYEYLKIFLNMGFKIIFWPHNLYRYEPYGPELEQMGIELVYGPNDFNKYIKNYGKHIDVAFLTRPDVAMPYIDTIKSVANIKVLYDLVDLYFLREERKGLLENDKEALKRSKEYKSKELYLIAKSDVALTLSPVEKEIVAKELPKAKTVVVPYIQEISLSKAGFNKRNGLFFLGGFQHPPNADGIKWFIKEVYPLVKSGIPDVTLTIVGSKPTPEVLALDSPEKGVKVVGYAKDVAPYFENARVFVSPLRYGAGIKGKNIQTMSFGLPMVTTSIGAEGLNLMDGQTAMITDKADDFARKVISLYKNNLLWDKISKQSIQYVKNNNSMDYADKTFRKIFSDIGIVME